MHHTLPLSPFHFFSYRYLLASTQLSLALLAVAWNGMEWNAMDAMDAAYPIIQLPFPLFKILVSQFFLACLLACFSLAERFQPLHGLNGCYLSHHTAPLTPFPLPLAPFTFFSMPFLACLLSGSTIYMEWKPFILDNLFRALFPSPFPPPFPPSLFVLFSSFSLSFPSLSH